jgi:predicted nucleic acid-binding protein
MYLLDTNILSELMRSQANSNVIEWLDKQLEDDLYISSITIAEIKLGIALLPEGKKRSLLAESAHYMLQDFMDRRLDFDALSAEKYANIVANCSKMGRPITTEDAQIAAICQVHQYILVTRNIRDFEMIDLLEVYNPF